MDSGNIHGVAKVTMDAPSELTGASAGTWTRTLKVQTEDGRIFSLVLFTKAKDALSVLA